MTGDYEEDVGANPLFALLRQPENEDLYGGLLKGGATGRVLCLPRSGCLNDAAVTRELLESHIMTPTHTDRIYATVNHRTVRSGDNVLEARRDGGFPDDRTVRILFDELFYDGDLFFHVLCVDGPLQGSIRRPLSSVEAQTTVYLPNRKSLPECREFLRSFPENSTTLRWLDTTLLEFKPVEEARGINWTATVARVRQIYHTAVRELVSANPLFKSLQANRIQADRLGHYIESYIMGELQLHLFVEVITAFAHEDSLLVAQAGKVTASSEFINIKLSPGLDKSETALEPAVAHINTLDDFKTPMEKLTCIRDTIALILKAQRGMSVSTPTTPAVSPTAQRPPPVSLAGDDILGLMIHVLVRANLVHLYSNVFYIRSFLLNPVQPNSEIAYNFATFEAAMEYLRNRQTAHPQMMADGSISLVDGAHNHSITDLFKRATMHAGMLPRSRSWENIRRRKSIAVSSSIENTESPPVQTPRSHLQSDDENDGSGEPVQASGFLIQPHDHRQQSPPSAAAAQRRANADPEDDMPEEGFFNAIEENDVERVARLIMAQGTSAIPNVNIRNEQGMNGLHLAAMKGLPQITQLLIDHAVDVNATTRHGTTALYLASQYNHIEVVRLLLQHKSIQVDFPDLNRNTALHAAAANGHTDTVEILLANGADINGTNNRGETPLHVASRWGFSSLVKTFIEHQADVNAKADADGATPLHLANDLTVISLLLSNGANVNAEDDEGLTPLHRAARQANLARMELLCKNGANVDARDRGQRTPLHLATFDGHMPLVVFLVDTCKASVNIQSKNGNTPLHGAVMHGHIEVVSFLISRGASSGFRNGHNRLPEDLAPNDAVRDVFRKAGVERRRSLFTSSTSAASIMASFRKSAVVSAATVPNTPTEPSTGSA